ncbi:MAG: hypothetical protein JW909_03825 [Planctomycetes bacterium]|nr:hypothetical protein [Planctomycetota bacterium]
MTIQEGCSPRSVPARSTKKKMLLLVSAAGVAAVLASIFLWWIPARRAAEDDTAFSKASAWAEAAGADTGAVIEAYDTYLRSYPSGRHVAEAKQRLNDLDERNFEQVMADADAAGADFDKAVESYEKYIVEHPNGLHISDAERMIAEEIPKARDDFEFASAEEAAGSKQDDSAQTIKAYETYLAKYPEGHHAHEAREQLRRLDESDFAAAQTIAREAGDDIQKAIGAYRQYLAVHPRGRRVAVAREQVEVILPRAWDDRDFALAKAAAEEAGEDFHGVISAYDVYLSQWPDGAHAHEAEDKLKQVKHGMLQKDKEDFEAAETKARERDWRYVYAIEAYESYLASHPDGHYAEEARAAIKALRDKEDALWTVCGPWKFQIRRVMTAAKWKDTELSSNARRAGDRFVVVYLQAVKLRDYSAAEKEALKKDPISTAALLALSFERGVSERDKMFLSSTHFNLKTRVNKTLTYAPPVDLSTIMARSVASANAGRGVVLQSFAIRGNSVSLTAVFLSSSAVEDAHMVFVPTMIGADSREVTVLEKDFQQENGTFPPPPVTSRSLAEAGVRLENGAIVICSDEQ